MKPFETHEIPILCSEKVRVLFFPVIKCVNHNAICRLYTWRKEEEKLTLGDGDVILNKFRWWIVVPFKPEIGKQRGYFGKRYCFSDLLLGQMVDAIIKEKMAPKAWCKLQLCKYAEYARQLWINNGEKYENLHKGEMIKEISAFFTPGVIKDIITELG